MVFPE